MSGSKSACYPITARRTPAPNRRRRFLAVEPLREKEEEKSTSAPEFSGPHPPILISPFNKVRRHNILRVRPPRGGGRPWPRPGDWSRRGRARRDRKGGSERGTKRHRRWPPLPRDRHPPTSGQGGCTRSPAPTRRIRKENGNGTTPGYLVPWPTAADLGARGVTPSSCKAVQKGGARRDPVPVVSCRKSCTTSLGRQASRFGTGRGQVAPIP